MMPKIRLLNKKDASIYRKLRLESLKESPLAFSESFENESTRDLQDFENDISTVENPHEKFILGAFSESDELIGFVTFKRDQRTKARHKSMIHAMFTVPEYRNKGIGKLLMFETISMARKLKGLEQIHLWVLHSKTNASGFYKSLGFESQGTLVKRDLKIGDVYVDAEYMVLYV